MRLPCCGYKAQTNTSELAGSQSLMSGLSVKLNEERELKVQKGQKWLFRSLRCIELLNTFIQVLSVQCQADKTVPLPIINGVARYL